MGVMEYGADEYEVCDCFSNSGFDLCEECAMKFALWFAIEHKKDIDKVLKTKAILDNDDGLWGYSKVSDFMDKEYERFKKATEKNYSWYDDSLFHGSRNSGGKDA
jgi:hypothetical protein